MLLQVRHLTKSFRSDFLQKPKVVLHDISFDLVKSKATGFIGVNGAGKTTTLKCLLGFLFPDSGQIQWQDAGQDFRKKLGYLPERPYYYEFITADEFLHFHWNLSGAGPGFEQARDEALSRVNLRGTGSKKLKLFSKGMLQRIGLAQALLRRPELLILDEPMSGLDPDGRALVKQILLEEKSRGTTLFFSSHLLADMEELCDELLVMDGGRVLFSGTQASFRSDPSLSLEKTFADLRKNLIRGESS